MADTLKNLKIRPMLHHEIDMEAARLKIPMYELAERAWQAYKQNSLSAAPAIDKQERLNRVLALIDRKLPAPAAPLNKIEIEEMIFGNAERGY
jgi:hypothetical protein